MLILSYFWGSAFTDDYAYKLQRGFARNLTISHEFVLVTDDESRFENLNTIAIPDEDRELLRTPGCFARLRMFDPDFQEQLRAEFSPFDRIVCVDLDSVVTRNCDDLFNRKENFVIMQGGNSSNPNPYGGALMMLRPNTHALVWGQFSLEAAEKSPHFKFPDDQGWLSHTVPKAASWKVGRDSGVYCFKKPGWPVGDDLPTDARIVTFRGNNPPAKHKHLGWVKEHWR